MRFVYFIQAPDDGPIKIGVAGNVWKRLAELQTAWPYELDLIGFIPSSDAEDLEDLLHGQFNDLRIRGEWFEPDESLLRYIREANEEVMRALEARRVS